ncbi:hypothetical protein NGR_c25820 [Sinorhizobium fredii NGR234]|uniref:VWFA-like protein with metal ion dependent adhesion motif (MIDAS) n=1 Tax=Sinorhizobium fredii (strain NBRC 101917 / NGR234) TaxID=394 RepID=C3MH53_SINFN|nr:DUF1194 domain-containing protein [Sinorhizobium fredii]ACP26339.1 hypothetical protein NGR_c25820 [Sinorhizobium fredii NGR234]
MKSRWTLLAASYLIGAGTAVTQDAVAVDLQLVLAVDVSYSIGLDELRLQRAGYVEAFLRPEIISAVRTGPLGRIAVTYVEWGGKAVQVLPWTVIEDSESAAHFAEALRRQPVRRISFTSISNVLAFARRLIRTSPYRAGRRVIDVSGDGPNNAGVPAPVARNNTVAQGIVIDGLAIMLKSAPDSASIPDLDAYYKECVIGGEGAFVMKVSEASQFSAAILAKLTAEISGLKVSDMRQHRPGLRPAAYAQSYNCFIGEELQERSIGR